MNNPKSTSKELVEELIKRNANGRYSALIERCQQNHFHDFKQPDSVGAPPKIALVEALNKFPELGDLLHEVINGDYDENPDQTDIANFSMPKGWEI